MYTVTISWLIFSPSPCLLSGLSISEPRLDLLMAALSCGGVSRIIPPILHQITPKTLPQFKSQKTSQKSRLPTVTIFTAAISVTIFTAAIMVTIFTATSLPKINVRFYVYIYSSQLLVKCVENKIFIFINIVCFSFKYLSPEKSYPDSPWPKTRPYGHHADAKEQCR